ncbi:MAG: ZIP family metal transporter [Flavobacterium sp.]|nr:MAG: ZIP family metal transporter [Flavobacterium sp.]
MNYLLPLLAVLAGYVIALLLRPEGKMGLRMLLAFSGSFLLSLTVMHLLPEIYESHDPKIGIFIMVGILFQIILEFFSKGAEHGHVHGHPEMRTIPWLLFISLCIHALLEGFPVSRHGHLALGIAVHHFPIAMILTIFFVNARLDKLSILGFMFAFALMTPLGTAISAYFPMINAYYTQITAIVIGILFHIASTIIFETTEGHKFNIAKVSMIILGIVLASML